MNMLKKIMAAVRTAARIWGLTVLMFLLAVMAGAILNGFTGKPFLFLLAIPVTVAVSIPLLVSLVIALLWLYKRRLSRANKLYCVALVCLFCTLVYGLAGGCIHVAFLPGAHWFDSFITGALLTIAVLLACCGLALLMTRHQLLAYFNPSPIHLSITPSFTMETINYPGVAPEDNQPSGGSNKIMIKGIITGILILAMMIPTVFIANLVYEREERQKEVAAEVSSKWATAQTLSGPYLYLPYKKYSRTADGKLKETEDYFWILPDHLEVSGRVNHEIRPRSIYKVLLYRTALKDSGHFIIQSPKDVDIKDIQWAEARVCYGLTDFKGIEEKLAVRLKGTEYELSPGLPKNDISETGLSVPVAITAADLGAKVFFDMDVKLKGSGQLHFVPLSGNSRFRLQSAWPSPSFDGNNLPSGRDVSAEGFRAEWAFNKANLPFGTLLNNFKFDFNTVAFGVTMLQPADQYAKTSRCVKYAILFIGLTFSLFFIVELTQKKPVHPMQYVLIGMALVIFYTLLLSISEFILFDYAYLIASLATVLLITAYARSHFGNWKAAGIFFGILSALYGFIFVLIRLEDTALLVGSIGLFLVLALIMYASRKINWYGSPVPAS